MTSIVLLVSFLNSAVNSDCMSGQRVGFVANFTQPGFIVKKWQKEKEGNSLYIA